MLGKLIKNEFRSTFRYYWIFFVAFLGITLAYAAIDNVMTSNQNINPVFQIFAVLLAIVYLFSNFFIALAPIIFSALRFNKSVLGSEGYLTNTLPVSTSKIVGAKLIIASVWFLTTSIWTLCCTYFASFISDNFKNTVKSLKQMFRSIFDQIEQEPMLLVVILIGLALLCISIILVEYASFSFSQIFNSYRGLKGSFIMIGILILKMIVFGTFAIGLIQNILGSNASDSAIAYWIFGVMGVNGLLFGSISYFVTQWALKKHLNLQ